MSRLASALTRSLEDLGFTQAAFGDRSGLTRVQVNRAARGSAATGQEVIAKIVRALPKPQNAAVLAAWLEDEVPAGLTDLVAVQPLESRVGEEPPARRPLHDQRRESLLRWVEAQISGVEFCDMIEALRSAISAR